MSRLTGILARIGVISQRSSTALTEATAAAATSCSQRCVVGSALQHLSLQHEQSGTFGLGLPSNERLLWRGFATSALSPPPTPPPNYFVGLGNLRDNPGATRQRIRVGRGNSARRGNYCGRGMKGQKSRGRGLNLLYDGGQLGFLKFPVSRQRPPYEVMYYHLGLSRVAEFVQLGLLDPTRTITIKDLYDTGCVTKNIKYGVLLYGRAQLPFPLDIQVTACDADTRACLESAGGRVTRVYYTLEGLGAVLHPEKYTSRRLPLPLPAARWHPKYDSRFDAVGQIPSAVRPNIITALTNNNSGASAVVASA